MLVFVGILEPVADVLLPQGATRWRLSRRIASAATQGHPHMPRCGAEAPSRQSLWDGYYVAPSVQQVRGQPVGELLRVAERR
jgi:hypothetical protein